MSRLQNGSGLVYELLAGLVHQDHLLDGGYTGQDLGTDEVLCGQIGGGTAGTGSGELEAEHTLMETQDLHITAVGSKQRADILIQYGAELLIHTCLL